MMRAATLGKTILIWENLTDVQVKELQKTLNDIILNYQELNTNMAIPLTLKEKFQYLVVMQKGNNVIVSANKIVQEIMLENQAGQMKIAEQEERELG